MPSPQASHATSEIEAQLLGVLVSAETTRGGTTGLLQALAPLLDDVSAAIAVRDRDGMRLHVLAETGAPFTWPDQLAPKIAIGAQPAVDPETNAFVIPLRAHGSVVGTLLLADARHATALLRDDNFGSLIETAAAVLHGLVERTQAEIHRRATAMRSVDSVVQGMAHQMANPLTGASAIAQLLMEELTDEGQRAALGQIHQEMKRAFVVLNDLLELHRDTHAQDGVIELSTFVERVLRYRGYEIREQGIALDLEMAPGYCPVRADARGLEYALLLTLRSAELRSHGSVNRSIGVRVADAGPGDVMIEVIDSGNGDVPEISPSYFDLPFLPAEHGPAGAEEVPDLGLVDSILRASGGRLEARGSKASGTTLALVLPRAASAQPGGNRGPGPSRQ